MTAKRVPKMHPSSVASFWSLVDRGPDCWLWTGLIDRYGYGRRHTGGEILAHRIAYRLVVGPIPAGLQLDHLCRNRRCVNPAHLEPVTGRENLRRSPLMPGIARAARTTCRNGHPYDDANTRVSVGPNGTGRVCRTCNREAVARYKARIKQEAMSR